MADLHFTNFANDTELRKSIQLKIDEKRKTPTTPAKALKQEPTTPAKEPTILDYPAQAIIRINKGDVIYVYLDGESETRIVSEYDFFGPYY